MRLEINLVDIETQLVGIDGILAAGNTILIPVITGGQQTVKFVIENMLPFQGEVAIAITISSVVVEIEMVLAQIAGKIQAVLLIDLVTDIEVEIIEGSPAILVLRGQLRQQPVRIRSPASKTKGIFILLNPPFAAEKADQQSSPSHPGHIL